ncbi:MAG: HU family DNA-binding protein [Balneolaceae bacterium]
MDNKVIKALRDIVREELIKRNSVEVEGLGRFEMTHRKQHQKKMEDGQVLMMPPRNLVTFSPEKKAV